tara:strand:+ start:403 stop:591 length:189 start_codon:yes stop_codon:yes gene_type:complete
MDYLLIPTILSISIQGLIGIISQIQHSRCTEIRGCCFQCKREVPKEQLDKPIELEEIQAREV